mmetsp:Transcript_127485/g.190004  ORF Transcript_127485/g.190004 Transcript_127485/m.190004 type:complete len:94 (-) Transcript_127485:47-328(-)
MIYITYICFDICLHTGFGLTLHTAFDLKGFFALKIFFKPKDFFVIVVEKSIIVKIFEKVVKIEFFFLKKTVFFRRFQGGTTFGIDSCFGSHSM